MRIALVLQCSLEMVTEFLNVVRVRPCFFFIPPDPSVRFRVFLGLRVRMSVIQTTENPRIGAEIHVSIYKKTSESIFSKKCYEILTL